MFLRETEVLAILILQSCKRVNPVPRSHAERNIVRYPYRLWRLVISFNHIDKESINLRDVDC